jgi:hypothetical protein
MLKYDKFGHFYLGPEEPIYSPPSMIGPNYHGKVFYNPSSGYYGTGSMYGVNSSYNTTNNLFSTGPSPINYPSDKQFGKIDPGKW